VHGLRRQTDVPHHRNLGARDARDRIRHRDATFEFHGLCAAVLHQPDRGAHGVFGRHLVGAERHVADDHRAPTGAGDEPRVVDHLVERHRQRGLVALHHIAEAVADQDQVDPGLVEDAREREVVGGQHRASLAALFARGEGSHGETGVARRGDRKRRHGGCLRRPTATNPRCSCTGDLDPETKNAPAGHAGGAVRIAH
jgi:hypothetical protein